MQEKETILDKLSRVISKVGTAMMMNLMFLVACLPIVTIGQAWCALFSALRYQIRGESWWNGFKYGFKTRFWRGTILWLLMLPLNAVLIFDAHQFLTKYLEGGNALIYPIASCFMLCLMLMVTSSFLILNVYIHTNVENWIRNAVKVVFKAPLQLLLSAAFMWAPLVLTYFKPEWVWYFIMIFVVIYFMLAALISTILMKGTLMDFLIDARYDGTLLSEEGRPIETKDEEEEEEESE